MNFLNKMERKFGRYAIYNLSTYIIGAYIIGYFLYFLAPGVLYNYLSLEPYYILKGQIWRLVTWVLIPPESPGIFTIIMLMLYYSLGNSLEQTWGAFRYNAYIFSGIISTIIGAFILYAVMGGNIVFGQALFSTYYINMSIFLACAASIPDVQVLLFFIIPIKVKYLAYLDAALFVFGVITMTFPLNLLPVVAVLNYLVYCGDWLFDFFRPSHVRQRQKTVNFKREARRIQREQANKPYHYKCAVCGRTDADHPELEFRYCSRCVGYHCFCQDHINNHIHFTE